jgi:hypothetical protein
MTTCRFCEQDQRNQRFEYKNRRFYEPDQRNLRNHSFHTTTNIYIYIIYEIFNIILHICYDNLSFLRAGPTKPTILVQTNRLLEHIVEKCLVDALSLSVIGRRVDSAVCILIACIIFVLKINKPKIV